MFCLKWATRKLIQRKTTRGAQVFCGLKRQDFWPLSCALTRYSSMQTSQVRQSARSTSYRLTLISHARMCHSALSVQRAQTCAKVKHLTLSGLHVLHPTNYLSCLPQPLGSFPPQGWMRSLKSFTTIWRESAAERRLICRYPISFWSVLLLKMPAKLAVGTCCSCEQRPELSMFTGIVNPNPAFKGTAKRFAFGFLALRCHVF